MPPRQVPVDDCVRILRQSDNITTAISRIFQETGRLFSVDGLRNYFRRNGRAAPTTYLGCGHSVDALLKDDEIPVEWDVPDDGLEVLLAIGDCHHPFVDETAWSVLLKSGRILKPDTVVIIGDWIDMLAVSHYDKRPDQMIQLQEEVRVANERLDEIDALGASRRVYCAGNHCIRGERLASKMAQGLFESLRVDRLLRLQERGWEYYPYRQHVKIGKLNFVHDVGFSGKQAIFQNGSAFESSTIQGHVHTAGLTYFGNAEGQSHVSATLGWLGNKKAADYMAPVKINRNWMHCFGVAYIEKPSGNSHFQIVPIIEGRAVLNGQLIQA